MADILIIDDEPHLTKVMRLNLEQMTKHSIAVCNDSKNAFELIKEKRPDLIILDLIMPEVQGNEVAEEVINNEKLKHIKIIFLTALVTKDEIRRYGENIGSRRFLAKPVKTDDLISAIEEELKK